MKKLFPAVLLVVSLIVVGCATHKAKPSKTNPVFSEVPPPSNLRVDLTTPVEGTETAATTVVAPPSATFAPVPPPSDTKVQLPPVAKENRMKPLQDVGAKGWVAWARDTAQRVKENSISEVSVVTTNNSTFATTYTKLLANELTKMGIKVQPSGNSLSVRSSVIDVATEPQVLRVDNVLLTGIQEPKVLNQVEVRLKEPHLYHDTPIWKIGSN